MLSGLSEKLTVLEQQTVTERDCSVATLEKSLVADAENAKKKPQQQVQKKSSTAIFGSTFLTIFLAECGDKTQISTLLMSAESHSPWTVFFGAAAALISTSLLGVLLGQWLAKRLSPRTIETAAGVSLLFIAATLLWDVAQF
jgi:putative Ca2+/H+ antiporter (TMEM165/GDT1 family)